MNIEFRTYDKEKVSMMIQIISDIMMLACAYWKGAKTCLKK